MYSPGHQNMPLKQKVRKKPGKFREFRIVFIQVWEKSGKTCCLVTASFSVTISIVVYKFLALLVVSKFEPGVAPGEG